MAIRISGTTGIDMGNTPVSNVDVGALDYNAVNKDYVDNNIDIGAITSYSQISGTNTIEGFELTNNIHDIFGDGSCVATYQLNGNANDLGGTYNGTAINVNFGEGKFGQAAIFNGSSKIINSTKIFNNLPSDNYTVSAWVNLSSTVGVQTIIIGVRSANVTYSSLRINNGVVQLANSAGVSTEVTASSTTILTTGVWYHITGTYSTSLGGKIYINAVGEGTSAYRALNRSLYDWNETIGGNNSQGLSYLNGSIDQLRIFNRALTEQEINTLYSETRPSADATLNINQGTFVYPKGLTSRGYVKSSDTFTGTIPTSGVSNGWKYVAKDENNNFSFYSTRPTLVKSSAELYLKDGKLYKSSDDTEITPISFLSNKVRVASSVPLELAPSGIAKSVTDSVEAKEHLGKNACTAWVNFDGTTTPPTIRDSYNVSSVVRTNTGHYDVYFKEPMDNVNYSTTFGRDSHDYNGIGEYLTKSTSKIAIAAIKGVNWTNSATVSVQIFGGKN